MADETVEVLVDVRQSGLENATAVRQAVEGIGQAAGEGGGSGATGKIAGLAHAFERWEAREPSRFIRQSSFALEGLALSAVGTEGPMGRLAASAAMFGTGGPVGLALLGGLAATALAFKLLNADAEASNKALTNTIQTVEKLSAGLSQLGQSRVTIEQGRGALRQLQAMDIGEAGDRELGWFHSLLLKASYGPGALGGALRFAGVGEGEATTADEARKAEATRLRIALTRDEAAAEETAGKAERARAQTIAESLLGIERTAVAYEHLLSGTKPTATEIERFAAAEDRLRLVTTSMTDAEREAELARRATLRDLQAQTADEQAFRATAAGHRYYESFGTAGLDLAHRTFLAPGRVAPSSLLPPVRIAAPPQEAAVTPGATDSSGIPLDPDARRAWFAAHPDYSVRPGTGIEPRERFGGRLASELPGFAAALAHGDAGAGIGAGGGILQTLSASKGLGALGLPGEVLTTLGGLVSLFGGGQRMKVAATLEAETIQRLKQELANLMPQNLSVLLVNSRDARATAYDLGRASRLDQQPRLPFSVS